ncbi:MAG: DUF1501 domain-containing protein, partial [Planctomycetota bacterium]
MPHVVPISRRQVLQDTGMGLGAVALSSMIASDANSGQTNPAGPLSPKPGHFAPRAKNIIHIHLVGAPSHLDLFDPKPQLQQRDGQLCPDEMFQGKQFAFIRSQPKLFGTPKLWGFS